MKAKVAHLSMNELKALIAAHAESAEELPLVHTTRAEFLPHFASSHQLTPRPCPVFREELVYLFYGRPAYRSTKGHLPGESVILCPVCFVFRPNRLPPPTRVFPCDTGAVHGNRFQPHLNSSDLSNLELDPHLVSARKLVPLFFQTNHNYFFGKAVSVGNFDKGSLAWKFHQLLLASGPSGFDDRKSAIELQYREPISLRDHLSFVVLPMEFLDDAEIRRVIFEEWSCDPEPYRTTQGASPSEYYSVVRRAIEERYARGDRI